MASNTINITHKKITLKSHLLFTAVSVVLWMLLLSGLRGLLLAYNQEMLGSTSTADLV